MGYLELTMDSTRGGRGRSRLWREQEGRDPPFVDARILADMKKTDRERDYAVIGELARILAEPRDQLLYSRSARDLMALGARHPELLAELVDARPVLAHVGEGRDRLEVALDAERRALMRANEERIERYLRASDRWARAWPAVAREVEGRPLSQAHARIVARAAELLPARVAEASA